MNRNKLSGKIAEHRMSQSSLANMIGISKNTLCSRINGKSVFNTDEIEKICAALEIVSIEEKAEIFLT